MGVMSLVWCFRVVGVVVFSSPLSPVGLGVCVWVWVRPGLPVSIMVSNLTSNYGSRVKTRGVEPTIRDAARNRSQNKLFPPRWRWREFLFQSVPSVTTAGAGICSAVAKGLRIYSSFFFCSFLLFRVADRETGVGGGEEIAGWQGRL